MPRVRAPIATKGFAERRHTAISSCAIRKAIKGIVGRSEASPFAAIGGASQSEHIFGNRYKRSCGESRSRTDVTARTGAQTHGSTVVSQGETHLSPFPVVRFRFHVNERLTSEWPLRPM